MRRVVRLNKTRINLWLDVSLFILWVGTVLTGLLLYFLPAGRSVAELMFPARYMLRGIHPWIGVTLLAIVVIHLTRHWPWLVCVAQRFWRKTSLRARLNFSLDSLLFLAFAGASLSGLMIWLVLSGGGYQGGRDPFSTRAFFGLARHDWRDLHHWAGFVMIGIVGVHLLLHRKWIVCSLRPCIRLAADRLVSQGFPPSA